MAKTIPNAPTAGGSKRPSGIFQADIDGIIGAIAGDGVLAGLGVSPQGTPDMTVAVAAGQARVGGYFPFVAAQNVTIAAADSTLDRFDLVVCDYNGVVSRVAGTAAAQAMIPAVPANSISLAKVFVKAAATAIRNDGVQFADQQMVFDDRCLVPDFFDIGDDFENSGLVTSGNIGSAGFGTTASGTAANAYQNGVDKHPGILRLVSGGTSGNNSRLHLGAAATTVVLVPSNLSRQRYLVSIPTITSIAVKLGFGVDLSASAAADLGTAGAFVEFVVATSAKWRYTTRQASTSTTNADTGADVVAGNWYEFQIVRLQNGNIQFAKNGVLQFTHTTNLPSTGGTCGALVHTLTAAARSLDLDLVGINKAPLGNRWT